MSDYITQEKFVVARDAMQSQIKAGLDSAIAAGADPLHMGIVLLSFSVSLWRGAGLDEQQVKELAAAMIDNISTQVSEQQ